MWSCLLLLSIATLHINQAKKTKIHLNISWEGPYKHRAVLGSKILLKCTKNLSTLLTLKHSRLKAIRNKKHWSIIWIHKNWNNTIDPWSGDSRRIYDPLEVRPSLKLTDEVYSKSSDLSIAEVDPTDAGVYACLLVLNYPLENGISPVNLAKIELISVHLIVIVPKDVWSPECELKQKPSKTTCNGFERWTFHRYTQTPNNYKDVIFQSKRNVLY